MYILTDGQVSNTEEILELIGKNASEDLRIYTIGLGDGCTEEFIIGGSE